jgi:glycosyltransferase involved in cell wall biosynthesis
MPTVLHLAHVGIPQDARILRELDALSESPELTLHAYGVLDDVSPDLNPPFRLRQFDVRSARASRIPRPFRYTMVLVELNARFLMSMWKLRPDVVHCHDTMVLPSGALAKVLLGSMVIYDAHELESDKAGQGRVLSKATLLIERACWRHIDRLITVSPAITAWYTEHLGPKPTACILNSPKVSDTDSSIGSHGVGVRDRFGIGPDEYLFVYVGGLEPGRGIDAILRAFGGADGDVHVAFIGWGSMQKQIELASQHHANIHHSPRVPHDQLVNFIRDATGGFCLIEDVSLSDHYCLPNKLFEYAFAGLPVIASRLPEIERVVGEYRLGVCSDLDEISILHAIHACATWPRDLPIERLAGLSWENQAQDLRYFYTDLLGSLTRRDA